MKTAKKQTKWGWGAVALVGLVAATTIEGSLIITAISVGVFAIGAYLGGYMDNGMLNDECRMQNEERRAA